MENILFTELTSNEQETLQGGSGYSTYGSPVNISQSSASVSQAQGQQQQGQLQQLLQGLWYSTTHTR